MITNTGVFIGQSNSNENVGYANDRYRSNADFLITTHYVV